MTLRDKAVCSTRSSTSTRRVPQKSSAVINSASPKVNRGQRVCRRLFGGIDCNDPSGWVTSQLKLLDETEGATLGYDFKNDCPIVKGNHNEYILQAVDEKEVPSFYRARTSSFNRRERIGPPDVFAETRKEDAPFVVIMQVHDSIAYNTRSHDIITFSDSSKTPESSVLSSKTSLSHRNTGSTQFNEGMKNKVTNSNPGTTLCRKRTMKQQTLTEYLPVVHCKRRGFTVKKSGSSKCSESKSFTGTQSFRSCKAQESLSDLITASGALKAKVCDVDNRRITRSMCA